MTMLPIRLADTAETMTSRPGTRYQRELASSLNHVLGTMVTAGRSAFCTLELMRPSRIILAAVCAKMPAA